MWRVIATDKDGREIARKEMDAGEFTIGRDQDRQMVLASPSVSRRHCRVRVEPTGVSIIDDGSANGIVINGGRVPANTMTAIPPGTRVEIAEFRLLIEQVGMAPQPMAPPPMAPPPMAPAPMAAPPMMPQGMPGMMPPQPLPQMPSGVIPGGALPSSGMPGAAGGPTDLVRLIAEGGQYSGRVFDLPGLPEITVGRGVGNDLVLDDPSMSRKHSKMRRIGGGRIEVEDLNSANGTYVNGRKITTAQAGPGDTVRFGELMFRLDGSGGSSGAKAAQASSNLLGPPLSGKTKNAFLGLAGVTGLVWLIWIIKLILPSAPPKGLVEQAIAAKTQEAENQVRIAKEAFNKQEWQKAKDAAEAALEIDPVSLEAVRLRAQSSRAAEDEGKYKQGSSELDKGTADGFSSAVRIFDAMSPDSSYRQEFADKLRTKLVAAGEDYFRGKKYRDSAEVLCYAFRVAPANQKPGPGTVKMLRDAEKRARLSTPCTVK